MIGYVVSKIVLFLFPPSQIAHTCVPVVSTCSPGELSGEAVEEVENGPR